MIDIHTHVLPGLDDGPDNLETSLRGIQQGMRDGIRGAVCTSHVLDRLDGILEKRFRQAFQDLKEVVEQKGWEFRLWLGSELHCQAEFDPRSPLATLGGNGRYMLMELPLGDIPPRAGDRFFQLGLADKILILAHPERNIVIQHNPEILFELIQRGMLIQLNAGSLTGDFGKRVQKLAAQMLDHRMVHFVASDFHDPKDRPMVLSRAYNRVAHGWGSDLAGALFHRNPERAVSGEPFDVDPPAAFKKKRLFFSR